MADSFSTPNVWPNYSAQNVQLAARKPVKELGKDQFLQILVTQLRNQDPMQPMQDKEFIAQMASFSSLEQMMNMSKAMTALQQSAGLSAGLIGMEISWTETTNSSVHNVGTGESSVVSRNGIVESIVWRDGVQFAKVGTSEVKVDEILSVSYPMQTGGGETSE